MSPVTYEWHLHPAIHKKYYMIFFRDGLKRQSEKIQVAWSKNGQPKMRYKPACETVQSVTNLPLSRKCFKK